MLAKTTRKIRVDNDGTEKLKDVANGCMVSLNLFLDAKKIIQKP